MGDCKVIAIYSNVCDFGRMEYAVNLAAALGKVAGTKVALIDVRADHRNIMEKLGTDIGIDAVSLEDVEKKFIEDIKKDYGYVIIHLPIEVNESIYETFMYSSAIHFFVDSIKDNLKKGYTFLEELRVKGLEDIHSRVKIVVQRLNVFDRFSIEDMSWLLRRDVWAVIPEPGVLEAAIDSEGMPLVLKSENSEYSKTVLYIAKKEAEKLLGLALGSGAAFGLAHIGILKTLEQNNITIDIISGSSIGGLIAAMWGLGFSSAKIERIARNLRYKLNIIRLLDFTIPISGVLAGKRLKRFLKSILGQKTFEDLQIPVKIVVYDLANRETLAIEKGSLAEAVYMTIAVPGIFKPNRIKERLIVDGGISDPVPVDALLKEGAKKIIAVNVLPGPEDIYRRNMRLKERVKEEENLMLSAPFYKRFWISGRNFLRRAFTPNIFDVIMTSMQSIEYILAENSCRKADVVLRPVFFDATSIDFHLVRDFIKRGEEEAVAHIREIKELVLR